VLYLGNLFLHHVALLAAENGAGFAREFQLLKDKSSDGKENHFNTAVFPLAIESSDFYFVTTLRETKSMCFI
jgi:hypothetical protein